MDSASILTFFIYAWFAGTMAKPAASLARSSSLCRSRRSIVPSSPQSQRAQLPPHAPHPSHPRHPHHPQHTQHSLPSPDPDILSVSSCPALYRNEEEEEAIYFSAEKQWYWQLMNCIQSGLGWAGWVGRRRVLCEFLLAASQATAELVASNNTCLWSLSSICQSPSSRG